MRPHEMCGLRAVPLLLALAYPPLAHLAIIRASAALTLASVAALVVVVLWAGLVDGRPSAWIAALGAALLLALLARLDLAALPLYVPPVLLNAFFAWLFGRTLRAGRTPLIERLIPLLRDPDEPHDPAIPPYARRLTLAWTILFSALAAINFVLALFAQPGGLLAAAGFVPWVAIPQVVWSWFANVINYLLVVALFVLEFVVRQRRFPDHRHRTFADFTRRVVGIWPRLWHQLRHET